MFNVLTGLALGIVIFAITIGVGVIVLQEFGSSIASCATTHTYNVSDGYCYNATGADQQAASSATQTTYSLQGELGSSGLAGWTAAIIALSVGLLFIGALMGKTKQ
jgi:hypothetical protein